MKILGGGGYPRSLHPPYEPLLCNVMVEFSLVMAQKPGSGVMLIKVCALRSVFVIFWAKELTKLWYFLLIGEGGGAVTQTYSNRPTDDIMLKGLLSSCMLLTQTRSKLLSHYA